MWIGLPWAVMLFLSGWDPQQVQASSIAVTGWFTEPTVRLIELVSFPTATVLIAGFIVTLTYSLFVIEKPINTWLATSMVAIYLGVTLGPGCITALLAERLLVRDVWPARDMGQ